VKIAHDRDVDMSNLELLACARIGPGSPWIVAREEFGSD
jgi:hypothetical protein